MQINCWDVSSDKTELTNMPDDVVCHLRSTLRDVSSDLTDEDMAVWQRHLSSSRSPGDAAYQRKPLTDF